MHPRQAHQPYGGVGGGGLHSRSFQHSHEGTHQQLSKVGCIGQPGRRKFSVRTASDSRAMTVLGQKVPQVELGDWARRTLHSEPTTLAVQWFSFSASQSSLTVGLTVVIGGETYRAKSAGGNRRCFSVGKSLGPAPAGFVCCSSAARQNQPGRATAPLHRQESAVCKTHTASPP